MSSVEDIWIHKKKKKKYINEQAWAKTLDFSNHQSFL